MQSLHSQNPAPGDAPIPGIQGWNSSECGAHETTCTAFPCLADVLEEQVRALEDETSSLCLSPPLLLSVSSSPEKGLEDSFEATSRSNEHSKFAQIPALRVSTFDNAQHQMMIPVNSLSTMFGPAAKEGERSQRGLPFQKTFSLKTLSRSNGNPMKPSKQGAPLAAALYNADCVRQGLIKSDTYSWSGCLVNPWCTLPPASHLSSSSCNSEAAVPGLAAYLPEELAALDLPVAAQLPSQGLLPPKAAKLVSAYLKEKNGTLLGSRDTEETEEESLNGKTTSIGKPVFAMDRFPMCFQGDKDGGVGIGVVDELDLSDNSSNTGDETVLPTNVVRGLPGDIESGMSKSSIVENTRLDEEEEEEEEDDDDDDDRGQNQNQNQQANSSVALRLRKGRAIKDVKTDLRRPISARTARRNVLHPASNGKVWTSDRLAQKRKAAGTAGALRTGGRVDSIVQKHKKIRKSGARHTSNSQNVPLLVLQQQQQQQQQEGWEEEGWEVEEVQEPVLTRKKAAKVSSSAGVQSNKKGSQRSMLARRGQQWITNQATDPRTGQVLSSVPPATFCTQCGATSTPVWRAGPFGHKTLCNACGVRWMKVAPKSARR